MTRRRGRVAVVVGVLAVVTLWSVLIGTARASADVPDDPTVCRGAVSVAPYTYGQPCTFGVVVTDVAPRLFGTGRMNEDESPYTGAHGGALVDYDAGIACYADHTATDGAAWRIVQTCSHEGDR